MSDNFGNRQNRVLSAAGRNLDNIVFQTRTPPLTSEWNLINQIGNEKIEKLAGAMLASGWMSSGNISCSETYAAGSFKLLSDKNNVAMVNGWPLLVQGSDSVDDDNTIILNEAVDQKYDFVFLEVWRKLIGEGDSVYPYGNVRNEPFADNELVWDGVGSETTKRVQIQFRIRTESVFSSVDNPGSGIFEDFDIHPVAGRDNGPDSFRKYSSGDVPGLYLAGDGSENSKQSLGTVDGYSYAIPMFLVYRRKKSDSEFSFDRMNSTLIDKNAAVSGARSDRPDGKLSDVVYEDDIVDLRHRVVASASELGPVAQKTLSSIISGTLSTAIKYGRGLSGQNSSICSGGSTLLKVEKLGGAPDNVPSLGGGSDGSGFKRRAFCNAGVVHANNVVEIPRSTPTWEDGQHIDTSSLFDENLGEVLSVDGFYSPDLGVEASEVVFTGMEVQIGASNLVGTAARLFMQFTYRYFPSGKGLKDVPQTFLEVNKGGLPIATKDHDILLRYNNSGDLLEFGDNPNGGDTNSADFVKYQGSNYTESHRFGHEVVLHRTSNEFRIVSLGLSSGKLNGYHILGIKSVQLASDPSVYLMFTAIRNVNTSGGYEVLGYEIELTDTSGYDLKDEDVIITCIHGNKPLESSMADYNPMDSVKFFDLTDQGRGVFDTVEMMEVIAEEVGSTGEYIIDTGDKPIISLGTYVRKDPGVEYTEARPFAYRIDESGVALALTGFEGRKLPVLSASEYSVDLFPTRIRVGAASGLGKIRVPVLVNSYVDSQEDPYYIYYYTRAYQGMLKPTQGNMRGKILCEGPAVVTSLGSGDIKELVYNTGEVSLDQGSRVVTGEDSSSGTPEWTMFAQSGDYFKVDGSHKLYRIRNVLSDISIELEEPFEGITDTYFYEIIKTGVPVGISSNVVDRMPAYKTSADGDLSAATDYRCCSDKFSFRGQSGYCFVTEPLTREQNPLDTIEGDFVLGNSGSAARGRNDFRLTASSNPVYRVGKARPYIRYGEISGLAGDRNKVKVYQTYLFAAMDDEGKLAGRVYLMVISGEGGFKEEVLLNPFTDKDTVDIFELDGKPVIRNI